MPHVCLYTQTLALQWLPRDIKYQWIFLAFRWIMAAYFLGWLVPSGLLVENGGVKYFIFLTNWCYLAWNSYLIFSAVSATVKVCLVYCYPSHAGQTATTTALLETPTPYMDVDVPVGCCGREGDATSWYHKIQWVLFYFGVHMAVVVSLLYWALLYSGGPVDGVNVNTHLVNAIIALIDVFISGIPVRILHFIYGAIFTTAYSTFTGIYFAAGGTNANGDPYIYAVLDYGSNPGSAAGWVLVVVLVIVPVVHLLLFGLHTARFWLTYHLWARREAASSNGGEVVELK